MPCSTALREQARVVPAHALVAEPLRLEAPRAPNCAGTVRRQNSRYVSPKRAVAGSCVGADAQVMAADVLDEEVLVQHRAEQEPAEDAAIHARLPVDQLVRDDDGRLARVGADEQHGHQRVRREEPAAAPPCAPRAPR